MTPDEFQALVAQLVDGELTADQCAALERHLRAHPEAGEQLIDHLFLASLLADEIGTASVAGLVDVVARAEPLPLRPRGPFLPRLPARWIASIAAVILLAVGAALFSLRERLPNEVPATLAQVVEMQGLELVDAQGEAKLAVAGEEIEPGQTLRTRGEESYAVLKSNGSTRLEMSGNAMARWNEPRGTDGGKRFFLTRGVLRVETANAAGAPITVTTAHAAIHAEGTFLCSTTADATYVEVETGHVRLVRQADGQNIEFADGFSVVAAADLQPLQAKPVAPTRTAPLHTFKKVHAGKLAFSSTGARLTTFDAHRWRTWDVATGQLLATHAVPAPELHNGVLSADARWLGGTSKGQVARLLDLASGREIWGAPAGRREPRAVALAPAGNLFAAAEPQDHYRTLIRLFQAATGQPIRAVQVPTQVKTLAFSADASQLAAGGHKGAVYLIDPARDQEALVFRELPHAVVAVLFSPDQRRVAAVSSNGDAVVWDAATRRELHRFEASGRPCLALAYSPGGRFLAAGHRDGTIKLWDLETGTERITLKASGGAVRAVAFSPDGRLLASASAHPVYLWQLPPALVDPGNLP